MRKFVSIVVLAGLLSGCTMSNEYGSCVGLATEKEQDPRLVYKVKALNVVLAVIFSETLVWPVLTGAFWLKCPVGRKGEVTP